MAQTFEIELNPQQRTAVQHGDGPLLVVAGAGTGKTRVITERIRLLLESDPHLPGESILGLTFTDKAANEMKWRIEKRVGERAEGVWLGTFHKFCLEQILMPANPKLKVIEDIDHWILLRRNIQRLELNAFKRLADPGEFLSDFVKFFSRCQDELVTPDDYQRYVDGLKRRYAEKRAQMEPDARKIQEDAIAQQEELARAYRISEQLLRERNLVTFGAQLMQAVQLLQNDAALLEKMRERYRYILVDEFQDTNVAQLELLRLLTGEQRNIFVVGDHNQAIYRFRGASFGSLKTFLTKFCGVSLETPEEKWPRVHLTRNYRSTKRILRVAGTVAAESDNSKFIPFAPLDTENPEGEKIRIVEFGRPEEEAEWIASEIERLHEAGVPWRDFAALYRKHTHRKHLVEALTRRQIPFVIKRLSILSSTLIRDLLAYLRIIAVPSDDVACARILAIPYWRIEPRDLVRLAERASAKRGSALWDEFEAWVDSPKKNATETSASKKSAADNGASAPPKESRAAGLQELIGGMRAKARKLTALELLADLIAELGLAPLPAESDSYNLERFKRFVEEWQKKGEGRSLRDFMEYLDFFDEAGGDIFLDAERADDAVQLMTVHSAKGLEFQHVFLLQLCKGDFPARPRQPVFEFPPELMKEELPPGDFQKQEERRLFYVALTRARWMLTLSTIINKRKKRSEFFDDVLGDANIQKHDVHQLAPRVSVPDAEQGVGSAPADASRPALFGEASAATKAYSHIALWARAFHPPRPEPLQLSASAIESYRICPLKYMFGHSWGLHGEPQATMTFGNVMHKTIKELVAEVKKRKHVKLEEVGAIYDRVWSSAGFLDDYHEQEYKRTGREQLAAFHQAYCAAPADVLMQEKPFELELENNVTILGRIDQVNRIGRDEVEVVDYKTGKPKSQKDADASLQLSLYALAAREVLELTPKRLVFYNLTTNEPVVTERDAKALADARKTVAETADLIRAGEFTAKPGFLCRYCDFQPLCPAHEQLITIRGASSTPS
ncbi:MAG: ATP-dependent DNA helicase [Candidatus Acidiferrales bacterium]